MMKNTLDDFKKGQLLLIDKPIEWSSFQVVNKLRWHIKKSFNLKKIKVGHAGTLDPLATGLLLICTGKMTKEMDQAQIILAMATNMKVIGKMIYMMGMALINGLMEESLREILKMEIKMVKELNFQY